MLLSPVFPKPYLGVLSTVLDTSFEAGADPSFQVVSYYPSCKSSLLFSELLFSEY